MPSSSCRSRNDSRSSGLWFGKRHVRGLCTNSCTTSAFISTALSSAFLIPPEQWAPNNIARKLALPREYGSPLGGEPVRPKLARSLPEAAVASALGPRWSRGQRSNRHKLSRSEERRVG